MGETKLCKYRLRHNYVKLSLEVASTLTVRPIRLPKSGQHFLFNTWLSFRAVLLAVITAFNQRDLQHPVRLGHTTYALGRVTTVWGGIFASFTLCFRKIVQSVLQLYVRPDMLARSHGAFGCLFGLLLFPFYLVGYVLKGFVVYADRLATGIANGCFHKDLLYVFDPSVQAKVYSTTSEIDDILQFERPSEKRVFDIKRAMQIAIPANQIFKECQPCFPPEHWHWEEVEMKKLKEMLRNLSGQTTLGLSDSEYDTLTSRLDNCNLEAISFSRFCLYIAEAVKARFVKVAPRLMPETEKIHDNEFGNIDVPMGGNDDDDDSDDEGVISRIFTARRLSHSSESLNRRLSLRMTRPKPSIQL
jgi:hypothetical protein